MFRKSYSADQKLEIVILGAMRDGKNEINFRISKAISNILDDDKFKAILTKKGVIEKPQITFPEEWKDNDITSGVFNKLDTADLVIVNITPKKDNEDPTPNVFYELGLIHSLGIPHLIISKKGTIIPFYIRNLRCIPLNNFGIKTIFKELKPYMLSFIEDTAPETFTDNPVSSFYGGLPVIDISAAVGLATGYYMNFVKKLLKEGEFITNYPDKIKQLVVVRPQSVFNTYDEDKTRLKKILLQENRILEFEKLEIEIGPNKASIWFEHLNGIVIDIPRTIYPLKRSPRILSLRKRIAKNRIAYNSQNTYPALNSAADKLLDKVEDIIWFLLESEIDTVRSSSLQFSSFENLNSVIDKIQKL